MFYVYYFFFNDTATPEIYTLSLHDALPIWRGGVPDGDLRRHDQRPHGDAQARVGQQEQPERADEGQPVPPLLAQRPEQDRKSTRLNSSHANISYAVFCLKKKKQKKTT